jgi:hypothetical protein
VASRSDQVRDGRYVQGGTVEQLRNRLGWWERRFYAPSVTDIQFTITSRYARRPDLLAFDVYGQATLQWVILLYNNIVDINLEFRAGQSILLPTRERVQTEFLTKPLVVTGA